MDKLALVQESRVRLGLTGWVRGAVADTFETGADGRASTLRFNLLPALTMTDEGLAKQGD